MRSFIFSFVIVLLPFLQVFAGEVIDIDASKPLQPVLSVMLTKQQAIMMEGNIEGTGKQILGLYLLVDNVPASVPVAGRYEFDNGKLSFTPLYSLGYDTHFEARYNISDTKVINKKYKTPKHPLSKTKTTVLNSYPLSDTIPYNTLFFHVRFSQPILKDKHAYQHVKIYDADGVERPRAWRQKSFWLDSGKLLVLMIHPGRVKNGIHYESPLFDSGKYYTLKVMSSMKDANSNELKQSYEQRYYVNGEDRVIPKMNKYQIKQPSAGTIEPIKVYFSEGMDNASVVDGVKVLDRNGNEIRCVVRENKTDYMFTITPEVAWQKGSYTLKLKGTVSDYSGNRINRLFEIKDAKEIEKDALVNKWEFDVR